MSLKGQSRKQTKAAKTKKNPEEEKLKPLTIAEEKFVAKYIELSNGAEAIKQAGFKVKDTASASVYANRLLKKSNVLYQVEQMRKEMHNDAIATGQEVMEYFSKVMRGEIKDVFGLDASLSERTRAAMELAKRTTDIENREKGIADNKVEINLNWKRD